MAGVAISQVLQDIIDREGGYVDHPSDKGGPTNYGITQRTLRDYRGKRVTKQDVKNLTEEEARKIYWTQYIKPFAFVSDPELMNLIADSSVHHGPQRTAKWLQAAMGVTPDGRPEEKTIAAYDSADPKELYQRVLKQREQLLKQLGKTPGQEVFAEGWNKRIGEFKNAGSRDNRGNP